MLIQRLLPVLERAIASREADRGAAAAALQGHSLEWAAKDGNVVPPISDEITAAGQVAADASSPADAAGGQITRRGEAEPASASRAPGDGAATFPAGQDPGAIRDVLAAMVERRGQNVQAVYDGLIDLGYIPGVPDLKLDGTRQLYVGWSDPARADTGKTKYTLYLEARIVSFGRATDRRKVADLPGADTSPSAYIAFRLNTPDAIDHALAAARAVKR
jgi:hypothetical protein